MTPIHRRRLAPTPPGALMPSHHHFAVATVSLVCFFSPTWASEVDFIRDIRPIISENCVFCHGPDSEHRQAGLRLDTADGLAETVEQGDPDASELLRRMLSDDPDELMPPPGSHRKLSEGQIELVRNWIQQGAPWQQHWSFAPLVMPAVPAVQSRWPDAFVRNPIDSFVQSRLDEQGLAAAPEADRSTLIRRVTLELTGLPPTPEEVDAFVADRSGDAYEKLVDRLLESPAYGQRMAWDWLDVARYADTNGYQGDNERTMWPWRDWVVRALNENMPYDQFTIWQLAGDRLSGEHLPGGDAGHEPTLATGFLRNHMINGEGGRIAEENRVEYVMDMSETMGTTWLGLTLNCCRCHDHKYDPITQEEYYQFFAFFNQTPVTGGGGNPQTAPNLPAPDAAEQQQLAERTSIVDDLKAQRAALSKRIERDQPDWERDAIASIERATRWTILEPKKAFSEKTQAKILPDHSVLSRYGDPSNDTHTFFATGPLDQVTAIRLEALRHDSMPSKSLSRAENGNFVLTDFEVSLIAVTGETQAASPSERAVEIQSAAATAEQGSHTIETAFDDDPKSGWAVWQGGGSTVEDDASAIFRFAEPVSIGADQSVRVVLKHQSKHAKHIIARYRLSVSTDVRPDLNPFSDELVNALRAPPAERTKKQAEAVAAAHQVSAPEYVDLGRRLDQAIANRDKLQSGFPKVMVMGDRREPRQTFVLDRGLYNKPADPVTAKLPAFLPVPAGDSERPADRLTLARWLVDDANPLTARVTVNRFWQQFFGIGLVKTAEDFGTQGEYPIHKELLDYLAATFRDQGWNVKQLVRTIVTSHTYRQSSKIASKEAYDRDPKNRYLSRASRYRLPSWMIRDQALAASGLLSPVVGGPAVNTYQPAGVWEEASFGKKVYRQDVGEKLYRRSLYVFWRRIIGPTMFFDSASRQTCSVKPNRTNTPLHSLQTMNNVAYVEAARNLAQRALVERISSDGGRLDIVFKRVLARSATEQEAEILIGGLDRTRRRYADDRDAAVALVELGDSPRDAALDPIEHASWTNLCLAVLNLDETLNRE